MIECVAKNIVPDATKKSCYDCVFCRGAVSWWCTNEKAKEYRGTAIPCVHNCKFWEPIRLYSELSWLDRIFGDHIVL